MKLGDISPGTELPDQRPPQFTPVRDKPQSRPLSKQDRAILGWLRLFNWILAFCCGFAAHFNPNPPSLSDSPLVVILGGAGWLVFALLNILICLLWRLFTYRVQPTLDWFVDSLPFGSSEMRFVLGIGLVILVLGRIFRMMIEGFLRWTNK